MWGNRGPFISCVSNGWSKDISFLRNFTRMIIQRDVFCYYQSSRAWGLNLVCFELGTRVSVWMFDVCFLWSLPSSKREHKYHKLDLRKEKERGNSNLAVSCWLPASTQLWISQPRIWWLSDFFFFPFVNRLFLDQAEEKKKRTLAMWRRLASWSCLVFAAVCVVLIISCPFFFLFWPNFLSPFFRFCY